MKEKKILTAFRLKPSEKQTIQVLAKKWRTTQVGVLRRLLTQAAEKEAN